MEYKAHTKVTMLTTKATGRLRPSAKKPTFIVREGNVVQLYSSSIGEPFLSISNPDIRRRDVVYTKDATAIQPVFFPSLGPKRATAKIANKGTNTDCRSINGIVTFNPQNNVNKRIIIMIKQIKSSNVQN